MTKPVKRALVLSPGELNRLLKITRATSKQPERDVLAIMLGHGAGLRCTEMSRITVADVMLSTGSLRTEVSLREVVTKGAKQRCAFVSFKPLIAAIETYLEHRIAHDIGTELTDKRFRGLLPHQPLLYSARSAGLSQNVKRRVLRDGTRKEYFACDALQARLTVLYHRAGILGSSHSGRRSFATRILAKTGSLEVVATLLGHASADDVSSRYCDIDPRVLQDMFATAI
jgi:integrase/recombinase XerC